MAGFNGAKQSSSPFDHRGSIMEEIGCMGCTSVDNYDQESSLGSISNNISLETEHVRNTFTSERNEEDDDENTLEDSPFVPKLNNESLIENTTNRFFSAGPYIYG